jgi:hypothetical protein
MSLMLRNSLLALVAFGALSAPAFAGNIQNSANALPTGHIAIVTTSPSEEALVLPVLEYELIGDDQAADVPDAAFVRPVLDYELIDDEQAVAAHGAALVRPVLDYELIIDGATMAHHVRIIQI